MRLQKLEQNEEVQHDQLYDYINCGECYLLTEWINERPTVTLNESTVLEDLHERHGGYIHYHKLCLKAFRVYKSMSGEFCERDMDKVLSWTRIDHYDRYDYTQLLKALITGEGLEEQALLPGAIVRYPNKKGGRGTHWYKLLKS